MMLTANHTINLHQRKNTFCKHLETNQMFDRTHRTHFINSSKGKTKKYRNNVVTIKGQSFHRASNICF